MGTVKRIWLLRARRFRPAPLQVTWAAWRSSVCLRSTRKMVTPNWAFLVEGSASSASSAQESFGTEILNKYFSSTQQEGQERARTLHQWHARTWTESRCMVIQTQTTTRHFRNKVPMRCRGSETARTRNNSGGCASEGYSLLRYTPCRSCSRKKMIHSRNKGQTKPFRSMGN
eukprot:3291636-Amphidinium_carterae.1